ncbi:MAG: hypothetical protein LBT43_13145 [Prevotella sp.]|nr:hypothetical protein [Prevotella sp.]MDR2005506.1 hypothetical protein [Prevotella sp.]
MSEFNNAIAAIAFQHIFPDTPDAARLPQKITLFYFLRSYTRLHPRKINICIDSRTIGRFYPSRICSLSR